MADIAKLITKILNFFLPLIEKLKYIEPVPREQNWHNHGKNYPQRKKLDEKKEPKPDKDEKESHQVSFYSPVEMEPPFITSDYGWRTLHIAGKSNSSFHYGVDFRARHGEEGYAVEDCVVTEIVNLKKGAPSRFKYNPKTGKWIDLKNGAVTPRITLVGIHTGNKYRIMHIKPKASLKLQQKLDAGDVIGNYGNYGYSKGSHCHFEVWVDGKHTNPWKWLEKVAKIKTVGRKKSNS